MKDILRGHLPFIIIVMLVPILAFVPWFSRWVLAVQNLVPHLERGGELEFHAALVSISRTRWF